jgi:hypothetical protein
MSDNPLSTNPILAADAHARYVPWLTDVDREIGCLVRVALQRDYSFLAAFHRGLSVPEAILERKVGRQAAPGAILKWRAIK